MPTESILNAQLALAEMKTNPVLRDWQERNHDFWKDILSKMPPNPLEVSDFQPRQGYPGTMLELMGADFGDVNTPITVTIGGETALVLERTPVWMRVLTGQNTKTGKVEVTVGVNSATGPADFELAKSTTYYDDGPPVVLKSQGSSGQPGLAKMGTIKVFVALVTPNDLTAVPANIRQTIVDQWTAATTYYNQASFGKCTLAPTVSANWTTLSGALSDYYWSTKLDADGNPVLDDDGNPVGYDNFWNIDRVAAEAVNANLTAINNGSFDMVAVCGFLNGAFCRGWGNMEKQTFSYAGNGLAISAQLNKNTPFITVGEVSDWGRLCHEVGHNIVDPVFNSATLGEDVYGSDLIDASEATAQTFDIMGNHDSHPLFSGFHLENLGWLIDNNPGNIDADNSGIPGLTNIRRVQWDRNPNSIDVDLIAHGLAENSTQGQHHVLKIMITPSLAYYVEVRQQPGATAQVFDTQIPVGASPNQGGVVVTRVLTDTVNNNQQTRFITLAHDPVVLTQGQQAVDPLRALTISVLNDNIQARPQICRVRIAWAQVIGDDPAGRFDLRITPWNSDFETPDIWIDRPPMGTFTNLSDSEGRPTGSGDKPLVGTINRFISRIHNDGVDPATNALVTFYSITPPGVGDNGSWTPLKTVSVATVAAGGFFDAATNWVPLVGEHTCLKVSLSQQLGEITGGNNQAQENIFDFDMPSSSPVEPVVLPVAIRNPSPRRERIHLMPSLVGRQVKDSFLVALPHQWVWVDGNSERILNLVVIAPMTMERYLKIPPVQVRVAGFLERKYTQPDPKGNIPGEFLTPIGGLTARCKPKRRGRIDMSAKQENRSIAVFGRIQPAEPTQNVLLVTTGLPNGDLVVGQVKATNGSFETKLSVAVILRSHPELRGETIKLVAVLVDSSTVTETRSAPAQLIHL
ncbi:IPT/TIG domain-containing protein [Spirosoma humi]